jgi:DNA invertase Pin-like site-specific DNA recombinase
MSAEWTTKAIGYVRVASGSARKRERSVYIQRQEILGYAKRSGIRIVRFFADHECIADIALRQGLSDALAFIASGKAQALAVSGMDRLSSSLEDIVRFAEQHRFLEAGAVLIAVQERLDTRTAEGRLALGVLGGATRWKQESQGQAVSDV